MKSVTVAGDFLIIVFPYDAELVQTVKAAPGRKYVATPFKHWSVPATPWHAWKLDIALRDKGFEWSKEAKEYIKQHGKMVRKSRGTTGKSIKGLFKYQSAAVEFQQEVGGRALIADDMGLGKTIEVLAFINERGDEMFPAAIVCPATVVYKWEAECQKWLEPSRDVYIVEGYKGELEAGHDIYIMSYNVMAERLERLGEIGWQLAVLDEVHAIKNHKAKRTRSCKYLFKNVKYILALDGTPFMNRPIEMFNALSLLDGKLWNNLWEYGNKYCGGIGENGAFKGSTNTEELKGRLTNTMIRRTKDEIKDQLPPLTRAALPVGIDMAEYKKVCGDEYKNEVGRLAAVRHYLGMEKVPSAVAWAEDFLETTDRKLVIFCYHLDVMEKLVDGLRAFGITFINGSITQKERASRIARFQESKQVRVIVINDAGAEGIDLYAASDILFVERLWVPTKEEQAEARLHRRGQVSPVTAWYLHVKGTIDEKLAKLVEYKREVFRSVLRSQDVESAVYKDVLEYLKSGGSGEL